VIKGLLVGGSPGQAIAATAFPTFGPRILLAGSEADGCALATNLGAPHGDVKSATIRLTLALGRPREKRRDVGQH
jgi:hypothetical protein